jgi:hypothetical protein
MPIIHECEQRSESWYALRAGMPTASEFSKLITSDGTQSKSASGYALTLAGEMFAGRTLDAFEGTSWTERGRELEEEAINRYCFQRDLEVQPVGFVTDDAKRAGCSPDGFVGKDGLVEVKCLKAENHIKAILYHQKHGRCPTDYVQQTQGQLWICERLWCDLIFYHPELPLLVIKQVPDLVIFKALAREIDLVTRERDTILEALRRQISPVQVAA